ncbi:uncharacterized protein LOC129976737 [Argiope bruennichi]|uniref:uncharacterized protein LOC129976737 n=1 Tax=Argiope bruennichi TaxID=94029 RepID=UPI0024957BA9|nr:uncharacterized protein LOC129976737 [Argiope bruennichi]
MADVKYVAAGFLNDAERLLQDFIKQNNMEFPVFAEVWKKHNFSLIYAYRPNGRELREFTLEIFELSASFLKSGSLLHKVGGTFLLYALYRNQILSPPLKIRIVPSLFKTILALLDLSVAKNKRSLHYVISYLVEHSFDFVASPKLKGPHYIKNENCIDVGKNHNNFRESDVKYEMTEISKSGMLPEIDRLFIEYKNTVLSLNTPVGFNLTTGDTSLKDFAHRIDDLLTENKIADQDTSTNNPKDSAIGSRRALIKAAAFSNPVCHYLSHDENNVTTLSLSEGVESSRDIPSNPPVPTTKVRKKRRVRKGLKKIGRPKKFVSDDSSSEKELQLNPDETLQEKGLSGRRRRKPRGPQFTKIRHYYADDFAEYDNLNVPSTSMVSTNEKSPTYAPLFSSESDCSEEF